MTDTLGRALTVTADVEGFLMVEAEAGAANRFTELEQAIVDVLTVSFCGYTPLQAQPSGGLTLAEAIPAATVSALSERFDLAAQQSKGAWWLPEVARVKSGFVNLPAYYATRPAWAMTLCGDDHGRFALTESPAVFASWAILAPFAADLLEPLILRGPDNGTLDPDAAPARWQAVRDRYTELGIATSAVLAELDGMVPGHGWSRLDAAGQQAAKQRLLSALGEAITAEAVKRWRVEPLRQLITRFYAKWKKGPPEARVVLVKAAQPSLAAFFGGDWLAFLDYLGEQPADSETILTALPEARLYVEASAKVEQIAAEQDLPVAEVSRLLASYLGSDAVMSPVQRRVAAIRSYWQAADAAHARQAPGMPPLNSLIETQTPEPGSPNNPFGNKPTDRWLPPELRRDIDLLWGSMVFPFKPARIVSTLSPSWSMKLALGQALLFWSGIGLTCWYICEGPFARSDVKGLRETYSYELADLAQSGTPVDDALFADLTAAEPQLGPIEQVDDERVVDAGHGVSVTFSTGRGTRRRGFEILRDIVTAHRRAWAATHLEAAIRSAWEVPLRDLAKDVNRAIAARGKLPTARQLAAIAGKVANRWFGGDLSATFAAIGEKPIIEQTTTRLLPHDRYQFCRRVFTEIGGRAVRDDADPLHSTVHMLLSLAANAPQLVQKQELLGQEPTEKEAGYENYSNWPEGLDYRRYLEAISHARQGLSVTPGSPPSSDPRPTIEHTAEPHAPPHAAVSTAESANAQPAPAPVAAAVASPAVPAGWYPDSNHAGVLRWWTGSAWEPSTAPGEGAAAGWFTDPDRTDQLRWWDGTAWTTHTTPAQAPNHPNAAATSRQPPAAVTDDIPPWEAMGLPCRLTDADFAVARRVAWQLNTVEIFGDRRFEPATGPWARYFNAAGMTYPENIARIRRLLTREPIAETDEGWAVYPAILIPDPSRSDTSRVPVGACSEVGYVGSIWCSLATSWARRVQEWLPQRRYAVTRLAVWPEVSEHNASAMVWVPTLDPPPWQREEQA